ncbi:hypothetical protein LP52_18000 [Streptomonospora alba]|uniref:Uncharacterized protein n=1 Tax=Streptomonospora alba TaxID=183763 RepID=A0A0C2J812_9ACTN|nr:hypothetical protein [Streptomonospora alba]KIH97611.1 hypothetical protein LP52_18000 [Streptomonospora alba]
MLNRLTAHLATRITNRLRPPRSDAGYSTEAVIVIALLATLALAALALISNAVMDRAESITLQ